MRWEIIKSGILTPLPFKSNICRGISTTLCLIANPYIALYTFPKEPPTSTLMMFIVYAVILFSSYFAYQWTQITFLKSH